MPFLKYSFRNVWRNKRRTFIAVASIAFATFFAIFMVSIQDGIWSSTIQNLIDLEAGYLQVQNKDYGETNSLNKAIPVDEVPDNIKGIVGQRARLRAFALISSGELTHGALIMGIEIEKERKLIENKLIAGAIPGPDSYSVAIGYELADFLNVGVGDTVVLIGQGYHGTNAVAELPVAGLMKFPVPEMNKQLMYMPLPTTQYVFRMPDLCTAVILDPENHEELEAQSSIVMQAIDTTQYTVKTWQELLPSLVEAKIADKAGAYVILLILYVIIGFGIFGVILMSVKERAYEFGVLVAIGMKRRQLSIMIWLETIITGIIGVLCGAALAYPIVAYVHFNPIPFTGNLARTYENFGIEPSITAVIDPSIFLAQLGVVLLMVTVLAVYPIWEIFRLDPVESMRE